MGVAESSRKVLVVEPDNLTRREIRVACEQDGYLVVEADAGSEALRQVESSRPNVVLLEVTLPDAAGFDVCRELRRRLRHQAPPAPRARGPHGRPSATRAAGKR